MNKSGEKAMNSTEYLLEFDEKNTQAMFQIVNSYVRTYLHNQILNKTVEKIRFSSIWLNQPFFIFCIKDGRRMNYYHIFLCIRELVSTKIPARRRLGRCFHIMSSDLWVALSVCSWHILPLDTVKKMLQFLLNREADENY